MGQLEVDVLERTLGHRQADQAHVVPGRPKEQAQQLLQPDNELSLAEIAARAGFSDQSQFSHHFKRLVGVTAGQYRNPSRIA